jgi:hypothetical protein
LNCQIIIVDCNIRQDLTLKEKVKEITLSEYTIVSHFPESLIPSAMNHGCSLSKNQWIWFLNSGDCIDEVDVTEIFSESLTNYHLLVGSALIYSENHKSKSWKKVNPDSFRFRFGINTFCHQACIFNRQILINEGGFSGVDHFDWISTFNLSRNGGSANLQGLKVLYLAGGISSKESLYLWGIRNLKIRKSLRKSFEGYFILDILIYSIYTHMRMVLNIFSRKKRLDGWWRVGN